jgi:hypothetical protein
VRTYNPYRTESGVLKVWRYFLSFINLLKFGLSLPTIYVEPIGIEYTYTKDSVNL